MDKYTYSIKAEKIQKLVKKGDYEAAVKVADTVDWEEVHSVRLLTITAAAYENVRDYKTAIELLQMAYEESAVGKRILYKLTGLAIADNNVELAQHYYEMYLREAQDDNGRYLLRYLLAELKQEPLDKRIAILETYRKYEFEEEWALRLAQLYDEAGMGDACVKLCDEIILWFGVGEYVDEALELKEKYAPLSAEQQEHRSNKEYYEQRYKEVVDEYTGREEALAAAERKAAGLDEDDEETPPVPADESWKEQIVLIEAKKLDEAVPKALEKLAAYYREKKAPMAKLTRISAERFNQIGLAAASKHIQGKDLLVDNAALLSDELLADIVNCVREGKHENLFVMVDDPTQLAYLDSRLGEFDKAEEEVPQIVVSELEAEDVLLNVSEVMGEESAEPAGQATQDIAPAAAATADLGKAAEAAEEKAEELTEAAEDAAEEAAETIEEAAEAVEEKTEDLAEAAEEKAEATAEAAEETVEAVKEKAEELAEAAENAAEEAAEAAEETVKAAEEKAEELAEAAEEKVEEAAETVEEAAEEAVEAAEEKAEELAEAAEEKAEEAAETAEEAAEAAEEKAEELAKAAEEKAEEAAEAVEETVETAEEKAEELAEAAEEKAEKTAEAVEEVTEAAEEKAEELTEAAEEKAEEAAEKAENFFEEIETKAEETAEDILPVKDTLPAEEEIGEGEQWTIDAFLRAQSEENAKAEEAAAEVTEKLDALEEKAEEAAEAAEEKAEELAKALEEIPETAEEAVEAAGEAFEDVIPETTEPAAEEAVEEVLAEAVSDLVPEEVEEDFSEVPEVVFSETERIMEEKQAEEELSRVADEMNAAQKDQQLELEQKAEELRLEKEKVLQELQQEAARVAAEIEALSQKPAEKKVLGGVTAAIPKILPEEEEEAVPKAKASLGDTKIRTDEERKQLGGDTKIFSKIGTATGKIGAIGMTEEAFVAYAKNYLTSIDCVLDEAGDIALQNAAEKRLESGGLLTKEAAENMIEEAADLAEKKGGLFTRRYDKNGCLILRSKFIK